MVAMVAMVSATILMTIPKATFKATILVALLKAILMATIMVAYLTVVILKATIKVAFLTVVILKAAYNIHDGLATLMAKVAKVTMAAMISKAMLFLVMTVAMTMVAKATL